MQVSDVYVKLGNDFNMAAHMFGEYDVDMSYVPIPNPALNPPLLPSSHLTSPPFSHDPS